ncbi:hypothetical protein QR680_003070 [Steinernema hermaphroditum]|uniref:Uncharacterized protein n=1 Tax=Steinernema hermaphroditum TaxID=289476 RepID=A0AA39H697_9BILA|nr:hypothetical protein QR680_003070 [Steinernema hermaphroditum]
MADCLLLSTILRSIRFSRPKNQSVEKLNGKNGSIYPGQQLEKAKSLDADNGNAIAVVDYESSCRDLAHIKQQLLLLKNIFDNELNVGQLLEEREQGVQDEQEPNPRRTLTVEELMEENDALRRQLLEKDKIIESLRAQLLLT